MTDLLFAFDMKKRLHTKNFWKFEMLIQIVIQI